MSWRALGLALKVPEELCDEVAVVIVAQAQRFLQPGLRISQLRHIKRQAQRGPRRSIKGILQGLGQGQERPARNR